MQLDKFAIATIIACFGLAQLSACVSTSEIETSEADIETEKDSYLIDTGEISENVDRFIGKSVLVRNDVLQLVGTRGLILDKDRLLDGDPILVINTSAISLEMADDPTPEILVDGKVERLNLDRIKQQYNLELEPEYLQYAGKPVIIAKSIILSPDPEDIMANPEIYYNQPLVIKGEVDDVETYGVFEIDEEKAFGGEDLIAIQPNSDIQLKEEQTVIAYGVVRQFVVEELERDFALGWNSAIKLEIAAKYGNKPVLVVDRIKVIP